MIKNFYDLEAWQKAHELALEIYKILKNLPKEERYGITDQLRRSSASVGANIAEGFGRFHYNDKKKFYYQARGSVTEIQNFLFLTRDLCFIKTEVFEDLLNKAEKVKQLINGLIRSIEKQS
jgi:four helix bundle protein